LCSTPTRATATLGARCRAASSPRRRLTTLGEGESYTTLEVKVNFLRPVRAGRLTASGRVKSAGRTVGLVECDVLSDDGKLVCSAASTCLILRGEQAAGR